MIPDSDCTGLRAVAFCPRVADSKALAAAFFDAGVEAAHIDGDTPTEVREVLFRRLKEGSVRHRIYTYLFIYLCLYIYVLTPTEVRETLFRRLKEGSVC